MIVTFGQTEAHIDRISAKSILDILSNTSNIPRDWSKALVLLAQMGGWG